MISRKSGDEPSRERCAIFFVRDLSQSSSRADVAHEIHDVQCAQAAAKLGLRTRLAFPETGGAFRAFRSSVPSSAFCDFYGVRPLFRLQPLPVPKWLGNGIGPVNAYSLINRVYAPLLFARHVDVVHTQDLVFAEASIKHGVPVVYEQHYPQRTPAPAIVRHPLFKVAVTQSEVVRESVVSHGFPSDRTVWMDNGFEPEFTERAPAAEVQGWRERLLGEGRTHLAVYSGALFEFKGVGLILEVASSLPHVAFALTGGNPSQIESLRARVKSRGLTNVSVLGWIHPRLKLVALFQAADLLLHPHLSGEHADMTNPVKFFQYLGSDTPVVATEIGPLMRFQREQLAIEWCAPDRADVLTAAVTRALDRFPRKTGGYPENLAFAAGYTWEARLRRIFALAGIL